MSSTQSETLQNNIRKRSTPHTMMKMIRIYPSDAPTSMERVTTKCVTKSVRDLLSEYVDPNEERHMTLPSRNGNEMEDSNVIFYLPANALPHNRKHRAYSTLAKSTAEQRRHDPKKRPARPSSDELREQWEYERVVRLSADVLQNTKDDFVVIHADGTQVAAAVEPTSFPKRASRASHLRSFSSLIREQEAVWIDIKAKLALETSGVSNREVYPANLIMPDAPLSSWSSSTPCLIRQNEEPIEVPGTNIKIFNQARVYMAIENGTATVLKCIGCAKHMLATKDIKFVFCPGCGTLSPISLSTNASDLEAIDAVF